MMEETKYLSEREALEIELKAEIERLNYENEKLKCEKKNLEMDLLRTKKDVDYFRGLVEGLKFALRCNGISGENVY